MPNTDVDDAEVRSCDATIVDRLNASFYGRFPFPWRPRSLDRTLDRDFWRTMLNQDVGDWRHRRIPKQPAIWVAGCGTNQAVITALKFPDAEVIGTDLSEPSLAMAADTAAELGIDNLQLRQESLNEATYTNRFDYIVCTGVIHHNANPQAALRRVADALKPTGILELMVYNRFHRIVTGPFQKSLRMLTDDGARGFDVSLGVARQLMAQLPSTGLMGRALGSLKEAVDVELADVLLQPVEHSYTIEDLVVLTGSCGLDLLTSCVNAYANAESRRTWDIRFADDGLRQRYERFTDAERWEITNLLLLESSPMLWFYCGRREANVPRQSEADVCRSFLDVACAKADTMQQRHVLDAGGRYRQLASSRAYPGPPADETLRRLVDLATPALRMRDVFAKAGVCDDFITVNEMRAGLATSGCPHLRAIAD